MSRAKGARPPLPPREKLRVDQEAHLRRKHRAEQRKGQAPGAEGSGESQRHARRRSRALRRKLAAGLPRSLRCSAAAFGLRPFDRAGAVGLRAALWNAPLRNLTIAGLLALLAEIVWLEAGKTEAWALPLTILSGAAAAMCVVRFLLHVQREAAVTIPAELSVLDEAIEIRWKTGPVLSLPLDGVEGVETSSEAAVLACRGGATIRIGAPSFRIEQLAAAVEVAREDLAGRRAFAAKPRRKDRKAAARESEPPAVEGAPSLPSEASLAALDRDGRPLEVWKQALRSLFADSGYRRAPPIPPEDLLQVVTDPRVTAERRIGAAIALSMRDDEAIVTRLRIASDAVETEALRVAVERAAEGILEEDALEEAVSLGVAKTAR
jgi:hypothetical protein